MTIQEAVAQKIQTSGENVTNIVVENLANLEIQKRVATITQAIEKQTILEKQVAKIDGKHDIITYVNGQAVQSMSEARFKEIARTKEQFTKLTKAIEIALETNTPQAFESLNTIIKSLGNAGNNPKESAAASE